LTSDKLESPQKANPTCALINSSASLKIAAARCHRKIFGSTGFAAHDTQPALHLTLFRIHKILNWIQDRRAATAGLNIGGKPWTQAVHRAALEEILDLVVKGKVKPIIPQVLPMARVADAHHHLSNRKTMGKVILQPRLA
jgi:NADPH:quinone reductase-like Zn-dependent oxidoreductase